MDGTWIIWGLVAGFTVFLVLLILITSSLSNK
jgi:hypothetical protein